MCLWLLKSATTSHFHTNPYKQFPPQMNFTQKSFSENMTSSQEGGRGGGEWSNQQIIKFTQMRRRFLKPHHGFRNVREFTLGVAFALSMAYCSSTWYGKPTTSLRSNWLAQSELATAWPPVSKLSKSSCTPGRLELSPASWPMQTGSTNPPLLHSNRNVNRANVKGSPVKRKSNPEDGDWVPTTAWDP